VGELVVRRCLEKFHVARIEAAGKRMCAHRACRDCQKSIDRAKHKPPVHGIVTAWVRQLTGRHSTS